MAPTAHSRLRPRPSTHDRYPPVTQAFQASIASKKSSTSSWTRAHLTFGHLSSRCRRTAMQPLSQTWNPHTTAIHQPPDPPSSLFSLHNRLSPSSLSLQGCAQQKGGGAVSLFHVSHLFTRLDKQITCFFSRFLNGVTLGWTCSNNKSMGRVKPSGVL